MASGTPTDVEVYVGSNSASGLQVGIYSDSPGTPSRLLAGGTLSAPTANAWNDVKLGGSPPAITCGTKYWISLGGTGSSGLLNFRDLTSGGTASYAANGLLSTWSSAGGPWPVGPASAYINGTTGAPSPPTNTALPTITGTTQQGQTLSTTTGTWNGTTPITYTYQWQRCTTTCTNITGATSSTYTLTTSDVGDTIDVIVTATNSAGNATATSPKTGTVTAQSGGGGATVLLGIRRLRPARIPMETGSHRRSAIPRWRRGRRPMWRCMSARTLTAGRSVSTAIRRHAKSSARQRDAICADHQHLEQRKASRLATRYHVRHKY